MSLFTKSSNNGVKVYRALLTQTGTNAPVATVLENTIGNAIWSYQAAGTYRLTLAGAFPLTKTFVLIENFSTAFATFSIIATRGDNYIEVSDTSGGVDNFLDYTPIEILVYP